MHAVAGVPRALPICISILWYLKSNTSFAFGIETLPIHYNWANQVVYRRIDPSVGLVLKATHYRTRYCESQFAFLKTTVIISYHRKQHSIPRSKLKTIRITEHVYGQTRIDISLVGIWGTILL